MKNSLIILAVMLALPFAALRAQTEDEQETVEFQLNDHYSVKLRQISESEYTARKNESEHLRHKPYEVITDLQEAQKMFGKKMKYLKLLPVSKKDKLYMIGTEITFKDGTKKRLDLEYGFMAYFPDLNVLLFTGRHESDYPIDLNDSRNVDMNITGNPYRHAVSPDKQWRINGLYGGQEGIRYWLEKWNPKRKKYDFLANISGINNDITPPFYAHSNWFWTSNSTALFKYGWWEDAGYYEMEIIIND